jgi:hypothetical protein
MTHDINYLTFFEKVTKIISDNINEYTDTCHKTGKTMLKFFDKEYKKNTNEILIYDSDEFNNFITNVVAKSSKLLLYLEFYAETLDEFTLEQRKNLMSMYEIKFIPATYIAFAMKKPKIRLLHHAINVLLVDDNVFLAQSWQGLQKYHIYSNPAITSKETFIQWLSNLINKIKSNPKNFINNFDPNYEYKPEMLNVIKNNEKIIEAISDEKFPYKYEIVVRYIIL